MPPPPNSGGEYPDNNTTAFWKEVLEETLRTLHQQVVTSEV